MDVNLPGIDGIEAARRISGAAAAPLVVLLSTYDEDDFDLSGCGAAAYISKSALSPDTPAAGVVGSAAGQADPHAGTDLQGIPSGPATPSTPPQASHRSTIASWLSPSRRRRAMTRRAHPSVVESQDDLAADVLEHLHAAVVDRSLDVLGEPRGRDGQGRCGARRRADRWRRGTTARSRAPSASGSSGRCHASARAGTPAPRWPGRRTPRSSRPRAPSVAARATSGAQEQHRGEDAPAIGDSSRRLSVSTAPMMRLRDAASSRV